MSRKMTGITRRGSMATKALNETKPRHSSRSIAVLKTAGWRPASWHLVIFLGAARLFEHTFERFREFVRRTGADLFVHGLSVLVQELDVGDAANAELCCV